MKVKLALDDDCREMLEELVEKTHQRTSLIAMNALQRGLYILLRETRVAWIARDHD